MGKKLKSIKPDTETLEQAHVVLREGGRFSGVALEHWLWLAEDAGERGDLGLLGRLEAHIDAKAFQKGLRRIHHKLRTRGVQLRDEAPRAASLAPRREFQGIATLASSEGSFLAYIACHVPGESSVAVLLQSMGGELRVEPGWMSRTEARKGLRDTLTSGTEGMAWYELGEEYARFFLYEQLRDHRPDAFDSVLVETRATLGEFPEEPERHPVEEALERRGMGVPLSVGTSGDLLDDPFYEMLRPTWERVSECVQQLEAIEVSPLVLADHLVMDRLRGVVDGVLASMIEESGRARVAWGLRHSAWLSTRHDRWGEAATLVRVARLVEEGADPSEIPLFLAMFQPLLIEFHARLTAPGEVSAPEPKGPVGGIGGGGLWLPGGRHGED